MSDHIDAIAVGLDSLSQLRWSETMSVPERRAKASFIEASLNMSGYRIEPQPLNITPPGGIHYHRDLLARVQAFLDKTYTIHGDARQKQLGLGYITAERVDLARMMTRFVLQEVEQFTPPTATKGTMA